MTETEKYKLKKPAQDDFYNVDDFNENADITEAVLIAHDEALSDLAAYIGYTAPDIYGVEVDFSAGTIKRIGAAAGLSPGADFDILPPWNRRRCIVGHDGTVYAYQGDEGYTETGFYTPTTTKGLETGTVSFPVNVCVEQLPFYYRIVTLDADESSPFAFKKARYYISASPHEGFVLPSCFKTGTDGSAKPIYLSTYETCKYDAQNKSYEYMANYAPIDVTASKIASVANAVVLKSDRDFASCDDAFSAFKNMLPGKGWEIMDEEMFALTQLLFMVEYATFGAQSAIGSGAEDVEYRGQVNLWGHTPCNTGYEFSGELANGYIASFAQSTVPLFIPALTVRDAFANITHDCFVKGSNGSYYLHGGSSADSDFGLFSVECSNAPYTVRFAYTGKISDRVTLKTLRDDDETVSASLKTDSGSAVRLSNIAAPTAGLDAVNKEYVDDCISEIKTEIPQLKDDLAALQTEFVDLEGFIGYTAPDIYGVEVDFENNIFTRLAGAVGKSAGADFDNLRPWARRRCIMTHKREILAYIGDSAYTESGHLTTEVIFSSATPTPPSNTYPVGTPVNVMVEQPAFYYRIVCLKSTNEDGVDTISKARYYISAVPRDGFHVLPLFGDDSMDTSSACAYFSAFESTIYNTESDTYDWTRDSVVDSTDNKALASIANAVPVISSQISDDTAPSMSEKFNTLTNMLTSGTGGLITSRMLSYNEDCFDVTRLLFMIEYASLNVQECIGVGAETFVTGGTSSLGNGSGANGYSVSYRGEENLWGCLWHCDAKRTSKPTYESGYISKFKIDEQFFNVAKTDGSSASPIGDCAFVDKEEQSQRVYKLFGGQNIASSGDLLSSGYDVTKLPAFVYGSMTFKDLGTVTFELYPHTAPDSVLNFIYLANTGHFNGTIVNRLVKDFVIQAGKFQSGFAEKDTDFEYTIRGEFDSNNFTTAVIPGTCPQGTNSLAFTKGTMAWVLVGDDPNSASTEFAIYTDTTTCYALKGDYAAFGKITGSESRNIINQINERKTYAEKPTDEIMITSVTINPVSLPGFEPDYTFPLPNFIYAPNTCGLFTTYHIPNTKNTPFTMRFYTVLGNNTGRNDLL